MLSEEEKKAIKKFEKLNINHFNNETINKNDLLSYYDGIIILNLINKQQEIVKNQSYTNKKLRNKIKTVKKERNKLQKKLDLKNKMIIINGEIISLNKIWNISKIENKDERIILINYVVDGKIIRYDLDYSDVKDDVNEEKTILEKDFEKLEKALLEIDEPEKKKLEARIKDLEFANSISRDLKDRYSRKIEAIYKIINSGKLNKNKLIREIIENEKF